MTALKPTKARLALLRAIDDDAGRAEGEPHARQVGGDEEDCSSVSSSPLASQSARWCESGARPRVVTARIEEMIRADWVKVSRSRTGSTMYSPRLYLLTDAGRAVLDGAS